MTTTKRTIKDGWHKICGWEVWVEDGYVLRGTCGDRNNSRITVYPYRKASDGGWDNCSGLSVNAFRAGVNRGTITMR